jgi:hypothetical protein
MKPRIRGALGLSVAACSSGNPYLPDPTAPREATQCQDGVDNDGDGSIDFDGGASLDLDDDGFVDAEFNPDTPAVTDPDPQCVGKPWRNNEKNIARRSCGLGAELVVLLPLLTWLWRRRRV